MRLIDANALELDVQNLWMQNEISNGDWVGFREMLNSQETIVEFDGDINKVMVKGIEYFPQKTGKWMGDKCSVCGKGIDDLIESSEWYQNESPRYCPFCGIKIQPSKAESEE